MHRLAKVYVMTPSKAWQTKKVGWGRGGEGWLWLCLKSKDQPIHSSENPKKAESLLERIPNHE